MYKTEDKQKAKDILDGIIKDTERIKRWPHLKKWEGTLKRWHDEILNHFDEGTSTAKVEGYNTGVKLLKRISFGMRNADIYAKKIMLGLLPMELLPHFLT